MGATQDRSIALVAAEMEAMQDKLSVLAMVTVVMLVHLCVPVEERMKSDCDRSRIKLLFLRLLFLINLIMSMDWNTIHLIKGKDVILAYHPESCTLKLISNSAYEILSLLQKGIPVDEIMNSYGSSAKKIENFFQGIEKELFASQKHQKDQAITKQTLTQKDKNINRITLHVSYDCNLRCKY